MPALAKATAVNPDAALLDLIARHTEVVAERDALDAIADPLRARFEAEAPEQPEALSWRLSDFARTSYGRGLSDPVADTGAREYGLRGVEWLRKVKPVAQWSAEAEARRREIVGAHDAWMADRRAFADRLGLTAANAQCDRASDVVEDVEMAVMDHVPMSLDGFRAKAQWIAAQPSASDWAATLLRNLCGATT